MLGSDAVKDIASEVGLRALVGLINDEEIPLRAVDIVVLLVATAHSRRLTHILQRSEIDDVWVLGLKARRVVGLEIEIGPGEDFVEVVAPILLDRRAVGEDEDAGAPHLLSQRQRGDGLPEAHLRVPQHRKDAGLETAFRQVDRLTLAGTQDDFLHVRNFVHGERVPSLLRRANGVLDRCQIRAEPFLPSPIRRFLARMPGVDEHAVNIGVSDDFGRAYRQFGMKEGVSNAGGLGVLVDALLRGIVQHLAIGRECRTCRHGRQVALHGRLTHLQ